MPLQQLTKPQVPTLDHTLSGIATSGSPRALGKVLTALIQYLYRLVLYLQMYLNRLYNALVPLQFTVAPVSPLQSPYPVAGSDVLIEASASSSAATEIDLPPATGSGRAILVMKMDSNPFFVNVMAQGNDTIAGAESGITITNQYDADWLIDDEQGNWLDYSMYAGLDYRLTAVSQSMSPYTVLGSDVVILTTGTVTVNLPPAAGSGRVLIIAKTDSGSTATVHPHSPDEISGVAGNTTLTGQYSFKRLLDISAGPPGEWINL